MHSSYFWLATFFIVSYLMDSYSMGRQFFDCNTDNMDSFELEIPSKCYTYINYSWHMEVKHVVSYIRNKKKCISDLKILLVSKSYVIIMGESGISDDNILINYGNDPYTTYEKYPECLPKDKHFYKFERDLYISTEKEDYWAKKELSSSTIEQNILKKFERGNLINDALMLGINSFLLIENLNTNKEQILFQNLSNSFYVITGFDLNNNRINIEGGKEILRNKTQHLGNEIYRQTCTSKNNRLKEVRESHTPEEKVRAYLHRADVTGVSTDRENVIIVEVCKVFIPVKYFTDHSIDNMCYQYMPVLSEYGHLLFVDISNYVHHFSPSKKCTEVVDETKIKKLFVHNKGNHYENFVNWFLNIIHSLSKTLKMGWWSYNLVKHQIIIIMIAIIIIIVIIYFIIHKIFLKKDSYDWLWDILKLMFKKIILPLQWLYGIIFNSKKSEEIKGNTKKEREEMELDKMLDELKDDENI
uniref:Protein with signal anchor n=1 Tax=Strongyloides papillosus TaxID=174720 RepID=A0A0N5BYN2_STREA